MKFPTTLSSDWIDFWENELTSKGTQMNQEQLTQMLTISENIQEQIEIVGELW